MKINLQLRHIKNNLHDIKNKYIALDITKCWNELFSMYEIKVN